MKAVGVWGETTDRLRQIPALVALDLRATLYLIMTLLALHLLNSYVYFGEQPFSLQHLLIIVPVKLL